MGITDKLRALLRRDKQGRPVGGPAAKTTRSVDTALIIEAARLVVTTRTASKALFVNQLYVTESTAEHLLAKLEHCKILAPAEHDRQRRVLTTSGQLPGVIAEFERRSREGLS